MSQINRSWSGRMLISDGINERCLFFRDGYISFASSESLEDRLGELAFQLGFISSDEWSKTATLVTKEKKLGQVLVEAGIISYSQLWFLLNTDFAHYKTSFLF